MSTKFRRLMTLAALAVVLTSGRAAGQETYDLLGPPLKEGTTLASTSKMTMNDADLSMTVMGMKIDGKMTMTNTGKQQRKILAIADGRVTKLETSILEGKLEQKMVIFGQEQPIPSTPVPLVGKTIISERTEKGWKHSLIDDVPNEMDKLALDNLPGAPDLSALYPKEKVAPGHTWEMKAAEWGRASSGMEMKDPKGEVKAKFVKVEEFQGQKCAVIEQEIEVKGSVPMPGGPGMTMELEMTLKGKATTHRSLKDGIDLKSVFEGEMTMGGEISQAGQKMEMAIEGKITTDERVELK